MYDVVWCTYVVVLLLYVCLSLMYVCCSLMYVWLTLRYVIMFVFIVAYTWQQSHDRNRTLVRYYVLQSRTNVWDLTKVIHNVIQRSTKLSTSYPQPNPKLSTRIINVVNRFNVRQTIINVVMKRFTSVIRTIRRPSVSNVRKSYPQVIHRLRKVIHNLSTSYPQAEANVCSAGRGRGGRTPVRVAEHLKDSYKFLKLGSLFRIV